MVTCQWAILPAAISPRVSVTLNQRMFFTVAAAFSKATRTASSEPFDEVPVIEMFL